jgi:hypothetical protein
MKNPMQLIDLREHAQLGIEHIQNSVDRQRNCRPYFRFNLINSPVWSQHEAADTPHTVGRFLHALNVGKDIVGVPDDTELLNGLRKQMFDSCEVGDGFAWDDMGYDPNPPLAYMHHQREALLGLIAIWQILQDPRAEVFAKALVTAMDEATREGGTYPGACLGPDGWQTERSAITTSGRAVSSLLAYSRIFGDPLGVELATRFGRHVANNCFGENGELIPESGTHIHSITGTVASLVELGAVTGEEDFIECAKRIYDIGLLPYRTQTGWVKESVNAEYGRGEANCTSDLIEAACLLGAAGYTSYFEDAERMLRNHLLASQMDDLSWVVENEGVANTETRAYQDLRRRARGAFCFGEPNGFHSYNSDLTGAALQGIAAVWEHIITEESDESAHINLLFSREHDAVRLTSLLPQTGKIAIEAKRPVALSVRIPPWVERNTLAVSINGVATSITMESDALKFGTLGKGTRIEITFDQPQFLTLECATGYETPYRVRWLGNTVIAMSGAGKHQALYPELD